MFERLTEPARVVVVLAQQEARQLKHDYVGTEHLLLALLREEEGVAARILLDFDAGADRVRHEVTGLLPGSGAGPRTEVIQGGSEPAIDAGWLDGLTGLLAPLGAEIRSQLGRAPDAGDLLLACACVPDTPAYQALAELGVDVDQLWGLIEHARADNEADRRLRDQERELREQAQAHSRAQLSAVDELRLRLGLATSSEP